MDNGLLIVSEQQSMHEHTYTHTPRGLCLWKPADAALPLSVSPHPLLSLSGAAELPPRLDSQSFTRGAFGAFWRLRAGNLVISPKHNLLVRAQLQSLH